MNLLVALDFSEVSEQQLGLVGRLCGSGSDSVYLLHVAEPDPDFVGYEAGPEVVRDQVAQVFHREHRRLQAMAAGLRERGIDATAILVQGSIVESVLAQAKALGAELIVVGSHGHGATYDLLVGSVSQGVIRKAEVPVLVVPSR